MIWIVTYLNRFLTGSQFIVTSLLRIYGKYYWNHSPTSDFTQDSSCWSWRLQLHLTIILKVEIDQKQSHIQQHMELTRLWWGKKHIPQSPLYIRPLFQRMMAPMVMTTTNGTSSRVVMIAVDTPWALWLAAVLVVSFSSGAASGCWCCFGDGSWIFCTAATGCGAGILGNGFRLACTNVSVSKRQERGN